MQLNNLVDDKSNFNIQLNRVAQIGFNAGQIYIFIKNNTLQEDRCKKIVNLVLKYKMFELDTYISSDIQELINKNIQIFHQIRFKKNIYKIINNFNLLEDIILN